ncbi:MAG: bidirectional hydrogenase complex protein HoxU [Geobacteraceae bacterium]|nr:bidirectional hydrogenase complex protein HoxU [Geobacteraceae bacterium]
MKRIQLTINGQAVTGLAGQTLLQVAQQHQITIPTLCNFAGLSPLGACRVCIVEVAGYPRPLPACATAAEQGMVVNTESERLLNARRMIVELLLAERNHTCPVCVMDGGCELQALAKLLAIDHVRYGFIAPQLTVDISQARFGIDHNRCILCRRCVRVCDEVEGAHTWDVSARGASSRIISDLAEPWGDSATCTGCGKCVQICPTGALFEQGAEKTRKGSLGLERLLEWRGRRNR